MAFVRRPLSRKVQASSKVVELRKRTSIQGEEKPITKPTYFEERVDTKQAASETCVIPRAGWWNKIAELEKKIERRNVKIVLLGETGCGKSSFINLFHFWSTETHGQEPRFDNLKHQSIIKCANEAGGSQSSSQTLKPQQYSFTVWHENSYYFLSVLDTPGMGDTRSLAQDDSNVLEILSFIAQASPINAIVLMLNGSNCRVSSRTEYILQRLYSMVPRSSEQHLYLILSNTQLQANFDLTSVRLPLSPKNIVPIDNLLFTTAGLNYATASVVQKRKISSNYEENKQLLGILFQQILNGGKLHLGIYEQLRVYRTRLSDIEHSLLHEIRESNRYKALINDELTQISSSTYTTNMLKVKARLSIGRVEVRQRSTPYHNTMCLLCGEICQENCPLLFVPVVGDEHLKNCPCMHRSPSDGVCLRCSHSYVQHVHVRFTFDRNVVHETLLTQREQQELEGLRTTQQQAQLLVGKMTAKLNKANERAHRAKSQLVELLAQITELCPYYDHMRELGSAIKIIEEEQLLQAPNSNAIKTLVALKTYFNERAGFK